MRRKPDIIVTLVVLIGLSVVITQVAQSYLGNTERTAQVERRY